MDKELIILDNKKIKRDYKIIKERVDIVVGLLARLREGSTFNEKEVDDAVKQGKELCRYLEIANRTSINKVLNDDSIMNRKEDNITNIKEIEQTV